VQIVYDFFSKKHKGFFKTTSLHKNRIPI